MHQNPTLPSQSSCESIQGIVERLTFQSSESGYTVARLKVPRSNDLVTIVGNFISIHPGQTLQLSGVWRENPKFGSEFQVSQCRELKPATLTGIEKYLGSGLIKGVGPITAKRIVAHFGLETLEILENQIERLSEVPGIAKKRINFIREAWITQKSIKEVMLFLQTHGVSTTYAVKIYKQYAEESIEIVSQNPYRLAIDVYGIGFTTADSIARNLGITPNSEFRYRSCLLHILNEASEEGHCFLPETELVERATERLKIPEHEPKPHQILFIMLQMVADEELFKTEKPVEPLKEFGYYAPPFYNAERKLAQRLRELVREPLEIDLLRVRRWIDLFTTQNKITLSNQQRQAVELAASQRIVILTGGPGTGKTFSTKTIVALWRAMGKTIAASSPTGRAAQRLSELTGQEAKTLHRLLEFDPKTAKFKRNQDNPLPAQAIVVDEISMLDLFLANSLIKAVPIDSQILLIGDIDQLPSVGPGNVLADLIASGKIPVVRLTQVFRQANSSKIVAHAHTINEGNYPLFESVSKKPTSDCLLFTAPQPENGLEAVRILVKDLIPSWGFNPATEVQVLSPVTKGQTGTRNLNTVLQQLLNPPSRNKAEIVRGGLALRVGDRVIQIKNNYTKEVFNGDLGIVKSINLEDQEVEIQFAQRQVDYDYADLEEISLAWAITVHKSQGSEYPVVILPVYSQGCMMLSRNLLYTALTRAKRLAVLVSSQTNLALAIAQTEARNRYTQLAERLKTSK